MKNLKRLLFASLFGCPLLTQCVDIDGDGISTGPATSRVFSNPNLPSFGQPFTSQIGAGTVTIREGPRIVSTIHTASPNVEQIRWHSEQERIVVKSRGNHGPATVQLFHSRSGREIHRVMAYDIRGGNPQWAVGMGD